MDEFEWIRSFATSSYGTISDAPVTTQAAPYPTSSSTSHTTFASFVCHVVSLERKLRSFSPIVWNAPLAIKETGKRLGQGTTFIVRHAQWVKAANEPPIDVAIKEIIADMQSTGVSSTNSQYQTQREWKDILFELRALLHEPVRYHPNLVRLLGIQWGLSAMSESVYPVLIMEYGSLGTFSNLQASSEPLSFAAKQKLCYDVGRGLTALHACGIVHGDIKHENVLIFPSRKPLDAAPYTAKLADFGGTVMDINLAERRKMLTWTWPFQAPEVTLRTPLTKSEMMLTDTYSFGLLLWRAFTDGEGFVSLPGAAQNEPDTLKENLNAQKAREEFTTSAIADIKRYSNLRGVSQECINIFEFAILHTVRLDPVNRNLHKAQAALRGIKLGHMSRYFDIVREVNDERVATEARQAPGRHGITRDALLFMLGRSGDDVDLQDNLPGNRPKLDRPSSEEFMFEPESLRNILTWDQQRRMIEELKDVASHTSRPTSELPEMKPTVAAFYVFESCLLEFGTTFGVDDTIDWLRKAAGDDNSHEDTDYLAQAWLWRIARALGANISIDTEKIQGLLQISAIRGHRNCLQELLDLANISSDAALKDRWLNTYHQSRNALLSQMGAVGMGYFFSSFMTPPWDTINIRDIPQLDMAIRSVLGNDYEQCLNSDVLNNDRTKYAGQEREKNAFDRIYVNGRGHGPLHYAAASGATDALRHMINTYDCNIDIDNQHVDETPLLCAASSGHIECALLLLDHGADPNGYRYGQEGPLHWLCSFASTDMEKMASRLIALGADVELCSGGMRHDVRGIRADWEHLFEIQTTPLGRAVLMNDLSAVQTLLKLGADPLTKNAKRHPKTWRDMKDVSKLTGITSPFELAAMLALPEILATFIAQIDSTDSTPKVKLIDEISMLDLARNGKAIGFDPLSILSRLVRGGAHHKRNLQVTLALLHARGKAFQRTGNVNLQEEQSRVLSREVARGDLGMVECLLTLGYNVDGTQHFRPLEKAVQINHVAIFNLLKSYKADVHCTQMTAAGGISLLHICASRPRQARPGREIADALIAAGVPLESTDRRSRSPFGSAVLNHNFDVATALLENGADIHATYPLQINSLNGPETKDVSVVVELLSQHTMRALESLRYLFDQYKSGRASRPTFLVDIKGRFSILHLLAGSPQFTSIAQITPKILNSCLEAYSEPGLINYRHPILGTPLYHAATNGNKAMVERLLERGANVSFDTGPDVSNSVQTIVRPRNTWTPLWAAIMRLDDEMNKFISIQTPESSEIWAGSNIIQNLEKIIEMLMAKDDDILARQAVHQLQQRKLSLTEEARARKLDLAQRRKEKKASQDERPIDLSALGDINSKDEKRIREVCTGPEEEWKTKELGIYFGALKI